MSIGSMRISATGSPISRGSLANCRGREPGPGWLRCVPVVRTFSKRRPSNASGCFHRQQRCQRRPECVVRAVRFPVKHTVVCETGQLQTANRPLELPAFDLPTFSGGTSIARSRVPRVNAAHRFDLGSRVTPLPMPHHISGASAVTSDACHRHVCGTRRSLPTILRSMLTAPSVILTRAQT
jgi:hypothetical protein